jgi:hypothetical protein
VINHLSKYYYLTQPKYMLIGISAKTAGTIIEKATPATAIASLYFTWFNPRL